MDKIKFYYKGELMGIGELMEGSLGVDRHKIARNLGIKIYDRMQFVNPDGKIRMDTDELTGGKDFLSKELNVYL